MNLDFLDTLRGLLGEQGITLVIILSGARWGRDTDRPGRRHVVARADDNRVEFDADEDTVQPLVEALEGQRVDVSWTGTRRQRPRRAAGLTGSPSTQPAPASLGLGAPTAGQIRQG
jgi:hypothetical protein